MHVLYRIAAKKKFYVLTFFNTHSDNGGFFFCRMAICFKATDSILNDELAS